MREIDPLHQLSHWDNRRRYRDPRHKMAEAFARPKVNWLADQLGVDQSTSVIDVGSGNGMFTWWWPTRAGEVTGIERSRNMIENSPCRDKMRVGDAYDLEMEDNSVDVAFAGNLLHHLERPVDALQEMARVSRRGVALVECNPHHLPMQAFGRVSSVCGGVLDYTRSNLLAMVHAAGLSVKAIRAHGWVYENRSPSASLPMARRLEARTASGAYWLVVAGAAGLSS
jgi:SAM-dependent methyltransferase